MEVDGEQGESAAAGSVAMMDVSAERYVPYLSSFHHLLDYSVPRLPLDDEIPRRITLQNRNGTLKHRPAIASPRTPSFTPVPTAIPTWNRDQN